MTFGPYWFHSERTRWWPRNLIVSCQRYNYLKTRYTKVVATTAMSKDSVRRVRAGHVTSHVTFARKCNMFLNSCISLYNYYKGLNTWLLEGNTTKAKRCLCGGFTKGWESAQQVGEIYQDCRPKWETLPKRDNWWSAEADLWDMGFSGLGIRVLGLSGYGKSSRTSPESAMA